MALSGSALGFCSALHRSGVTKRANQFQSEYKLVLAGSLNAAIFEHPTIGNMMRLTFFDIVHKNAVKVPFYFSFLTGCSVLTVADVHVDHQYEDVNLKVSSSLMSEVNMH